MSDISETSYWLKFFTEAGIPAGDATEYAIIFTDNRIKEVMLPELNKEYLKDMGISVMGDIIAILKHSKLVTQKRTRQKSIPSCEVSTTGNTTTSQGTNTHATNHDIPVKKSTAATRMLEHYVRKEPPPPSPPSSSSSSSSSPPSSSNLSPSLSARLGGTKRSIEDDEIQYSNKRSSVFNRLGDNAVSSTTSDSPKITITMLGKDKLRSSSECVSKKSTVRLSTEDKGRVGLSGKPLEYHGILKYSSKELASKREKEKLTKLSSSQSKRVSKADTTSDIRSRLGVSSKPLSVSEGIFAHEIPKRNVRKAVSKQLQSAADTMQFNEGRVYENPTVIKKIVKINKKTGHIVSEQKREINSEVFKRLR